MSYDISHSLPDAHKHHRENWKQDELEMCLKYLWENVGVDDAKKQRSQIIKQD